VPTAKEELTVYLSEQLLDLAVDPSEETSVIITFENKLPLDVASLWLKDFCVEKKISLQISQSYESGFHTVRVGGDSPEETLAALLQDPLLCVNGTWAALTPFSPDLDLEDALGLNQLIHIVLQTNLTWVERGIREVVAPLGRYVEHATS
jgi:hypothetical protein